MDPRGDYEVVDLAADGPAIADALIEDVPELETAIVTSGIVDEAPPELDLERMEASMNTRTAVRAAFWSNLHPILEKQGYDPYSARFAWDGEAGGFLLSAIRA